MKLNPSLSLRSHVLLFCIHDAGNLQTEDNIGSDLLALTTSRKSCAESLGLLALKAVGVAGDLRAERFPSRHQKSLL